MKIKHVTIQSSQLDQSVKFYEEIAGLSIQHDMRGKGPMNIVFLANASGETCVEIIETQDEAFTGSGISIGFGVEDVNAYHKELEEKGLNPTPIITPNPVTGFFFVKDPNGVQIQFINEK